MKQLKRFLCLALALALTAGAASALAAAERKKLTVIVYGDGADLESEQAYVTGALLTMQRSGLDFDNTNVVVMTGGSTSWAQGSGIPADAVTIQLLDNRRRPTEVARLEQMNMGDPATLSYLLYYAVEHYPADSYGLLMMDHGGGPLQGVAFDFNYDEDGLSLPELHAALDDSPFHSKGLDWIFFGTCLTANIETLNAVAPFAHYMFATEEPSLAFAVPYDFIPVAEQGDPVALGRWIVDEVIERADRLTEHDDTFACFDLDKVPALIAAFDDFFTEVGADLSPSTYSDYARDARAAAYVHRTPDINSTYDLLDLTSFVGILAPHDTAKAETLLGAIGDVTLYYRGDAPGEHGLAVYHPLYSKILYRAMGSDYKSLNFSAPYTDYMTHFSTMWYEGDRFRGSLPEAQPAQEDGATRTLTLPLPAELRSDTAEARLYILEDTGTSGTYTLVHISDPLPPDADGTLAAEADGRALYALDAEGRPLSGALTYTVLGDDVFVRALLRKDPSSRALAAEDVNQEELTYDAPDNANVWLRFAADADGALTLTGVLPVQEGSIPDMNTYSLRDYDTVRLVCSPREMTRGEDGAVLAWDDWQTGSVVNYVYTLDAKADWRLAFVDERLSWNDRWAMFVVTDTYGNRAATSLVRLENPNSAELDVAETPVYGDADAAVTLKGAALNTAEWGGGLTLRLEISNLRGDQSVTYTVTAVTVNGTPVEHRAELLGTFAPGGTGTAACTLYADELAAAGVTEVTEVGLTIEGETDGEGFPPYLEVTVPVHAALNE